jgi:hypothetical protein
VYLTTRIGRVWTLGLIRSKCAKKTEKRKKRKYYSRILEALASLPEGSRLKISSSKKTW